MQLNIAQKIGLGGLLFVVIIASVLLLTGHFSAYIFIGAIPFSVLLLIASSVRSSKK